LPTCGKRNDSSNPRHAFLAFPFSQPFWCGPAWPECARQSEAERHRAAAAWHRQAANYCFDNDYFDGALYQHERLLELEGDSALTYLSRARVWESLGNRQAIIDDCTKTLALASEEDRALSSARTEEAVAKLAAAQEGEIHPTFAARAKALLAQAHEQAGRSEQAAALRHEVQAYLSDVATDEWRDRLVLELLMLQASASSPSKASGSEPEN
jgi:tetratricopeptide (TPR) repeat protein